jgi:multiple sugar transport system permease protein
VPVGSAVPSPRPRGGYRGYVYVAPLLLVLAAVVLYPVAYNTATAFYRYDQARDALTFVGLANFRKLFASSFFWDSFRATLVWVAGNIALQFVVGIAVALALNRIKLGRGVIGGLFLVPWISSYVIVAVLWQWVYHPQLGVLNDILLRARLIDQPIAWLAQPGLAMVALIVANSWKFFPLMMLTLLAGLQGIPREFWEVAAVEAAGRWQTFRLVIFPALLPSISAAVLVAMIWAFNGFTLPFIMTGGGPLRSTEILGFYIYKEAFVAYDFGAAAAGSIFLFAQIGLAIAGYLWLVGREHR